MRDTVSILPLRLDGVGFSAGGRRLVDCVSFAVPKGGLTILMGPNGAGKSLTLRLCHGLIAPSQGRIAWASEREGRAQGHAMVFQKPVMLRRSVEANIRHALRASGLTGETARVRASLALGRFGLAGLIAQPARLLSGGEQQRLAIARAWALQPEILFLDEPTSQLDPSATRQIEDLLRDLVAEGLTVMMSTHDLGQARRLGDRVLFMHRGRLIEDGPAAAFFAAPETPAARAFLAGDLVW